MALSAASNTQIRAYEPGAWLSIPPGHGIILSALRFQVVKAGIEQSVSGQVVDTNACFQFDYSGSQPHEAKITWPQMLYSGLKKPQSGIYQIVIGKSG